jgi:Uma2 family endonuclease
LRRDRFTDDRLKDVTERAQDYVALGVPETWILDLETKEAFVYSPAGLHKVQPGVDFLRCGKVELDLGALFGQLA